jgi:hypothetical protein
MSADKLRIPGTIARDLGVMIVSGMLHPTSNFIPRCWRLLETLFWRP